MARITLKELKKTLDALERSLGKALEGYDKAISNIKKDAEAINKSLEGVGVNTAKDISAVNAALKETEKIAQEREKTDQARKKTAQDFAKVVIQQKKVTQELQKIEQNREKLAQEREKTQQQQLRTQEQKRKADERERKQSEKMQSSYAKQSKRLNDLRKKYKDLRVEEGKATRETEKLRKEIEDLDESLKQVDAEAGQFQRNVGNYPDSLGDALKSVKKLTVGLLSLKAAQEGISGSLESSQEGSEDLRKVTSGLSGGLTVLKNTAASAALDLIDFGKAVFDGKKNITDLGDSFDRTAKSTENFGDKIKNAVTESIDSATAQIELEKQLRKYEVQLAKVNTELERQQFIAGDTTKSFDEIEQATEKATVLNAKRIGILKDIAKQELDIINDRIDTRKRTGGNINDLLDEQLAAQLKLLEARRDFELSQLDIDKTSQENARDRFERELDFAIDAFDAQKTVNERRIGDDRLSLEERERIAKETEELASNSFENQKKLLKDFTGEQLDIDDLVRESNEENIRSALKKLNFDDVTLGRTLEIIKERKLALQDLADTERDLNEVRESTDIQQQNIELQEKEIALLKERLEGKITEDELNDKLEQDNRDRLQEEIDLLKNQAEQYAENSEKRLEIQEQINDKEIELLQSKIEKEDKLNEEQADRNKELIEESISLIETAVGAAFDKAANKLSSELEQSIALQERLNQAAADGSIAAEQSLIAEEKRQRLIEEKQRELEERRLKTEAAIALLNAYAANGSITDTLGALTVINNAVSGLNGFYEGTDSVGTTGTEKRFSNGRDGHLVRVNSGERIFNNKQTHELDSLGFNNRDKVMRLARMASKNNRGLKAEEVISLETSNNQELINEVKGVKKEISNLKLNVGLYLDGDYVRKISQGEKLKETLKKRSDAWRT